MSTSKGLHLPANLHLTHISFKPIRASDEIHDCILQTDTDKLNDSYAALERKAALYDRLSVGRFDDDDEQYNVDFLQKGMLSDEMPGDRRRPAQDAAEPIDTASMAIRASGTFCYFLLLSVNHPTL